MNTKPENADITDEEVKAWLHQYNNTVDEKKRKQIKTIIMHHYLSLVKKIAHGLARRQSDPIEDIIQVGCVGLIKAIDQYKKDYGASFKTYATYRITGEIRHYLRDKTAIIRAPRELLEISYRMNNIIEKLQAELGRTPTEIEIAEQLQMPVKRVSEVFEVDRRKQTISLDQMTVNSNSEQPLAEKLVDSKNLEYQDLQEERIMLKEAVELLPEQLQEVVQMSFFEDLNQSEIAKKVGISQMQVSRRIKKATNELFNIITKQEKQERVRK